MIANRQINILTLITDNYEEGFILALAAAAVMSCSESEEIENAGQKAEIKLGTVVGNTTRATVTDLPELQKVGFTVYAYNTGATTMASVATFDAMKEFMAAVKVTYSAPDWSLTGGTYYWPMTDNLQFFAYGNPGTGALTYNQPAAGAIYPSITYTVADVAAQTDLVAAKVTDATKASNASGVSLKFGHILTQINFTVKAADALTYKLKTLTISGVHNKGTYGFDDSTWKSQEGTATYAHTIDDGALEVNTTGVEVNTAWMLMPQTLDTNAKINVVYDIYEKDVLLDTVTSAIDLNDTQAWGEGKKIRYTLTLANKAAKVTFVPEVGPWSTAMIRTWKNKTALSAIKTELLLFYSFIPRNFFMKVFGECFFYEYYLSIFVTATNKQIYLPMPNSSACRGKNNALNVPRLWTMQ